MEYYDQIVEYLQQGLNVDTIYLDFSKAFNKVDHGILLDKLEIIGIKAKIKEWIASFLADRYQRVTVNGFLSDPMHVKSGVPQGSVIGPLLFLILISDIDYNIVSHTSSFADDTRLMKSILTEHDCSILQSDLQRVAKVVVLLKDISLFVKIRSMQVGLSTFLKQVGSLTKHFR